MRNFEYLREEIQVYGCLDDYRPKGIIARVLAQIPQSDFDILWEKRQMIFIVPGEGGCMNILEDIQPGRLFLITVSEVNKNDKRFAQDVAHELAHVFYEDDISVPEPVALNSKIHNLWMAIQELRTDLKIESWGFLEIKEDSYLYGSFWDSFDELGVNKVEAIKLAKLENNEEIFRAIQI